MKIAAVITVIFFTIYYFTFYSSKIDFKVTSANSVEQFVAEAPDILKAQFSINNKLTSIAVLKDQGKFTDVLIHFWATWCGPCLEELPRLYRYAVKQSQTSNAPKIGYIFVAVADSERNVSDFLKKQRIDKSQLGIWVFDNQQESYKVFRVDKVPESYVLRSDGSVSRLSGAQEWR